MVTDSALLREIRSLMHRPLGPDEAARLRTLAAECGLRLRWQRATLQPYEGLRWEDVDDDLHQRQGRINR